MNLKIEDIIPLIISDDWKRRLVGEYYEVLIRCERLRDHLDFISEEYEKRCEDVDCITIEREIIRLKQQYRAMLPYRTALFARIVDHNINRIEILASVLPAESVLTEE